MKEYSRLNLFFIVIILAQVVGCTSEDGRPGKGEDPGIFYFDYRVWGDEERNIVTVTLQYRKGDAEGDPVSLVPPARVELDGNELLPDSSVMNGVYYEISTTVPDFEGDHRIVYTDKDGKTYTEEFNFTPMMFRTELPATLSRKDLVLELGGIDTSEFIHVIMTDTSFYGRGIDRVDTVRDGRVVIGSDELGNLKDGPVFLEFYREENWPLKETTGSGGRLNISYNLKRSFELGKAAE